MNFRLLVPPIAKYVYHRLYMIKNRCYYTMGMFALKLPFNHLLPLNQKISRLYDKFLTVLVRHIDNTKTIVDVGANVGDTAVAMLQNCKNPLICVEPSEYFFEYLEKNVKMMGTEYSDRATLVKSIAGTGDFTGQLVRKEGTARIVTAKSSDGTVGKVSLDNIAENSEIAFVKVDTDGFDFDVLLSGERTLLKDQPILMWENEIVDDFQFNGYKTLFDFLEVKNYKHVYLFDNYGNFIAYNEGFNTLRQINSYLYSMKKYKCRTTIHYTDVVAVTDQYQHVVKNALEEYIKDYIQKN